MGLITRCYKTEVFLHLFYIIITVIIPLSTSCVLLCLQFSYSQSANAISSPIPRLRAGNPRLRLLACPPNSCTVLKWLSGSTTRLLERGLLATSATAFYTGVPISQIFGVPYLNPWLGANVISSCSSSQGIVNVLRLQLVALAAASWNWAHYFVNSTWPSQSLTQTNTIIRPTTISPTIVANRQRNWLEKISNNKEEIELHETVMSVTSFFTFLRLYFVWRSPIYTVSVAFFRILLTKNY